MAGEDEHTLIDKEMPSHSHALVSSTTTATTPTPSPTVHLATASGGTLLYAPAANAAPYAVMAPCVAAAGNSVGHLNIMPTLVANYCIAFNGIFPSQS
jgi:microcystin-dependent protein